MNYENCSLRYQHISPKPLDDEQPSQIRANGFKAYKYTSKEALARWIEEAAIISQSRSRLR
jgi:hypothetical protein